MAKADEAQAGLTMPAKALSAEAKPEGKRARRRKAARNGKPELPPELSMTPNRAPILLARPSANTTTDIGPTDIGADKPMLLLPAPVALLKAAAFPSGLVAPPSLGVAITAIAMPEASPNMPEASPNMPEASPKRVAVTQRPPRAEPKTPPCPAASSAMPLQPTVTQPAPAMPLPRQSEPLVTPAAQVAASPLPDDRSYFAQPEGALPRAQALAAPSVGLVGAIGAWLSSMGKLIASGFMVTKTRKRGMPVAAPAPQTPARGDIASLAKPRGEPPTMRERTEMTQLRAENRRLRAQLEAMQALRSHPEIPRWSERAKKPAKEQEGAD